MIPNRNTMLNRLLLARFVAKLADKTPAENDASDVQVKLLELAIQNRKGLIRFKRMKNDALNIDLKIQYGLVELGLMEWIESRGNGGEDNVKQTEIYKITEKGRKLIQDAINAAKEKMGDRNDAE